MEQENEDPRITEARNLYLMCEENPRGHMVEYWVERIVNLINEAKGKFSDIGATSERLRQLSGETT